MNPMQLSYMKHHEAVRDLLGKTADIVVRSHAAEPETLLKWLKDAGENLAGEGRLRIALVGEYSAGKSSIISALTGQEILIDADVSTSDICDYDWRGHVLTDTPGVQSDDVETDHDLLARRATVGADIVLFVLSNELFTPRLAAYLNYLIGEQGLGLSGKTAVIVNKMDRENNPEEVILHEVRRALTPHDRIPVFFCAAGRHLQAAEAPDILRDRFIRQGRMEELVRGLDAFLEEAGKTGRLTTPLQTVSEVLDAVQDGLAESEESRARLEILRRQRVAVDRIQREMDEIHREYKGRAYSTIRDKTELVVREITGEMSGEELEALYVQAMKETELPLHLLYGEAGGRIQQVLEEAAATLEEILESAPARFLDKSQYQATKPTPGTFGQEKPPSSRSGRIIVKGLTKPLQGLLKRAGENNRMWRNILLETGHKAGYKFRPWQAGKLAGKFTKTLGRLSKAMPIISTGIDIAVEILEEKEKEARDRRRAELRLAIRSEIVDQAAREADHFSRTLKESTGQDLLAARQAIDAECASISAAQKGQRELLRRLADLRRETASLRARIYSMDGAGNASEDGGVLPASEEGLRKGSGGR